MINFKNYLIEIDNLKTFLDEDELDESYNFLPSSSDDILASGLNNSKQIVDVFTYLRNLNTNITEPIAIEIKNNLGAVKIHRSFEDEIDLKKLKQDFNAPLNFGNGSRGNMGANNQGNAFEKNLAKDLNLYVKTRNLKQDYKYPDFIESFGNQYLLNKSIEIEEVGGLNNRRPIKIEGSNVIIANGGNIGETVSDITVLADKTPIYLSLKLGSQITFFNIGIKKIFSEESIINNIYNKDALAILNMFGIEPDKFSNVFNKYNKNQDTKSSKEIINVTTKINKNKLLNFLESGIGYGYFLVHAESVKSNKINWFYMEKTNLKDYLNLQNVHVIYPKNGSAKRVDVIIETSKFKLKVNIRSKDGSKYPTHIMCDYLIKH